MTDWQLVPKEPTDEMRTAFRSFSDKGWTDRYRDMLASAPKREHERNAVIEECARVAEDLRNPAPYNWRTAIAAAIRALKDKP